MPDKNPDVGPSGGLLHPAAPAGPKRWGRLAMAAIVIAAGGIGWRLWSDHTAAESTEDQPLPTVQVIKIKTAKNGGNLTLPGDLQAFASAPIYAQVSGYVQKWFFDIGAQGEERRSAGPDRSAHL